MSEMKDELSAALVNMLVDSIVARALLTWETAAVAEGIPLDSISPTYREAVETGAYLGAAQTMLALRDVGLLNTLDKPV